MRAADQALTVGAAIASERERVPVDRACCSASELWPWLPGERLSSLKEEREAKGEGEKPDSVWNLPIFKTVSRFKTSLQSGPGSLAARL